MFPRGGDAQTPHDHVVAGVVSWVLDGHVLKDLTIGPQNIVRPGPHLPLLFRHRPSSLMSIPRSPPREEVCGDVLKPHRRHRHCGILFQSPSARSLQIHIEVARKNQLCPPWRLHHRRLHIPNRCVVKRCQVTSNYVPSPIPRHQMARNDVCVEVAYRLDCKGGGFPVFVGPIALSCIYLYRPAMVVILFAVILVAVFVNVVAVVVLGAGRPHHGPLPPCHPPNGENTKA